MSFNDWLIRGTLESVKLGIRGGRHFVEKAKAEKLEKATRILNKARDCGFGSELLLNAEECYEKGEYEDCICYAEQVINKANEAMEQMTKTDEAKQDNQEPKVASYEDILDKMLSERVKKHG
jgi:hypothetical protein